MSKSKINHSISTQTCATIRFWTKEGTQREREKERVQIQRLAVQCG